MIDKPHGKFECFLEAVLQYLTEMRDDVKEVFEAGYEPVAKRTKAHPTLTRIVTTAACVSVCVLLIAGYTAPRTVYVKTDDSRAILTSRFETTSKRVDSLLENHDIDYEPGVDIIDVEMYDSIYDGMTINITKAFDVKVQVEGNEYTYHTLSATAGEVLDALDISLGNDDLINFKMDDIVKKDDVIVINRVTVDFVVEEEKTDYKVKYVADNSMPVGSTKVEQKGQKGLVRKTYLAVYVDGEEISRTLTESETVQKKKDKIIHYGTKILEGVPAGLKYKEKFTKVRAVSYYYSTQRRGVYGMECAYGTCAVDRKLIPLGSLLYIEGYGYAVANDVGTAIKGKTVDLYMERLGQCGIWGARWTNVYVIEYGDDTAFWER